MVNNPIVGRGGGGGGSSGELGADKVKVGWVGDLKIKGVRNVGEIGGTFATKPYRAKEGKPGKGGRF